MKDRSAQISEFIAGTDWAAAQRAPLAGDASNRRYERLRDASTGRSAVLMDAPPDRGEDVRPFIHIAEYLTLQKLSAPRILAQDIEAGLLIIEDLGDDLFARILEKQPDLEPQLYRAATDLLIALGRSEPPPLDRYTPQQMAEFSALAFTRYADALTDVDKTVVSRFIDRFSDLLYQTTDGPAVLIQRDYHAENLLWLPDREDIARVGLLDFQDALLGHPAYDLVSLLQDARRDVSAGTEMRMIAHFIEQTGSDDHAFRTAYAALGVQRNLRIIGVFARLGLDHGKPRYIDLIPRVWAHMVSDLDHPALAGISDLVLQTLPRPTKDDLIRLKEKCATPTHP
ncbi:aminoglycoside phosphotransferase family protein [Thalassococcus sp. S3]|uniref:aminoglycoside phosphotransferase family protein n=1 Tax=Thalassococcus sp. S3 TaxID=2017482 RepID=UPI0010240BD5|nr:phosphotransferase [Thalassococcus sp. S3]QBF29616.1 aminoglycoside phosphotransferase [Thalassococcus sp. S3]